ASDAGRAMAAENASRSVLPLDIVENEILGRDDVTFQPNHFRNVGDAAGTVAQACGLDDDIDRTDDDLAHGLLRQHIAAHGDHGFHAVEAFTRAVGVYRAHRTIVARIHGLHEIEYLGSAHFAHDDAFGPHAQAVLHKVAHGDFAFAFQIGRAGF